MDSVTPILVISIILQGFAALFALSLIPVSKKAFAWIILSLAFLLMTLRRLVSYLTEHIHAEMGWLPDLHPEVIALIVSFLIFIGVLAVRQVFLTHNRAEQELRESQERYELVSRGANEGIWDWDIGTDYVYYSPRWYGLLGLQPGSGESNSKEWFQRIHIDDLERVTQEIDAHFSGRSDQFVCEYRMKHQDGSYRWVFTKGVVVKNGDGRVTRMAGSMTDITDRKNVEAQLIYDALHDVLTGMPNRTLFIDRIQQVMLRSSREPAYSYAVLFIDLDRFKLINETMGHLVGDLLLIEVSKRLSGCVRDVDTVARIGGDEFVVLLDPVNDVTVVVDFAEAIQRAIAKPFEIEGRSLVITASLGVVYGAERYREPSDILRDADTALHRAKTDGRNRFVVFRTDMYRTAVKKMEIESGLRMALEQNQLQLFYQPLFNLTDSTISSCEALIRWNHPEKGIISPEEFIPVAEETALIYPLGEWVVEEACRQLNKWAENLPADRVVPINVNVSGKQFFRGGFVEFVSKTLKHYGVPGRLLRLEITESSVIENIGKAIDELKRIRGLDVCVYLDDFGTGYSSLSYLHKLPVHGLKIDRSFVKKMAEDKDSLAIVKTIIRLSETLNMSVVAEGVERQDHSELLQVLGCNVGQGYYYSYPIRPEIVETLLGEKGKAFVRV